MSRVCCELFFLFIDIEISDTVFLSILIAFKEFVVLSIEHFYHKIYSKLRMYENGLDPTKFRYHKTMVKGKLLIAMGTPLLYETSFLNLIWAYKSLSLKLKKGCF